MKIYLFSVIYFGNSPKIGKRFLSKLYIKKIDIKNHKVLFLSHRLLFYVLEKRIKHCGHRTNFLSGEQILSQPPQILRVIQYKTSWMMNLLLYLFILLLGSNLAL